MNEDRFQVVLELMPVIGQWLADNDITPATVPLDVVPTIADGTITVEVFVRNEHGKLVLKDGQTMPSRSTIRVPLKVAPPSPLNRWLYVDEGGSAA